MLPVRGMAVFDLAAAPVFFFCKVDRMIKTVGLEDRKRD